MISSLEEKALLEGNDRLRKSFDKTQALIEDLNQRELPPETKAAIQAQVENLNSSPEELKAYKKALRKAYSAIVRIVKKDMNLSTKGYYMTMGMSLGMAAFGIPLGIMFGAAMDNMGLMSIGIPIGLGIGMSIGTAMDQKAAKEGRQLSI
ncbi:MAG: hypothetical protein AAFN10_20480 [Bacteroidota bacterium]